VAANPFSAAFLSCVSSHGAVESQACCQATRPVATRPRAAFALGIAALLLFPVGGRIAQAQAGEWVWANGNSLNEPTSVTGVYGTLGIASSANTPPGRDSSTTWTDSAGNLWLFGGAPGGNFLAVGPSRNDLWKFNPSRAEWTWESGTSNDVVVNGTYGQLGVPDKANIPGSRAGAIGWVDGSDDLWLFGGSGYDSTGDLGVLDDLWEFNPRSAEWTWMGGNDTIPPTSNLCTPGVYGTLGVPAATNLPGPRAYGGAWTDASGDFWMFGGEGCGDSGGPELLNDLWSYRVATGQWTWEGGHTTGYAVGIYGSLGVASDSSFPGSRYMFANWSDSSGDFWMFGGEGLDLSGTLGSQNDLWRFNPATRQWAWINGSDVIGDENCSFASGLLGCSPSGVYGTLGQPAADNVPGGRVSAVGAAVGNGSFLLFGGSNQAGNTDRSNRFTNAFDDLWQFNPASSQWTWVGGSDRMMCGDSSQGICIANGQPGVYGTKAVFAAANHPGSREGHVRWADAAGNFWIFGGDGFDSDGIDPQLNDIWEYKAPPTIAKDPSIVVLTSSVNPAFTKNPIVFTAQVGSTSSTPNVPTGRVQFSQSTSAGGPATVLGTANVDASGKATLSVASLPVGTFDITATYSGDSTNLLATGSTTEVGGDFSLATTAPTMATVATGGTATFNLTLTPIGPISAFPAAIALAAAGGPSGALYAFAPAAVSFGSAATTVTLTVTLPAQTAHARTGLRWPAAPVVPLVFSAFVLPFMRRAKARGRRRHPRATLPALLLLALVGLGAALALGGCGNSFYTRALAPGAPAPPGPQIYTLNVTGASGPLTHSAAIGLTVD
jgi:N-acetylneuraminic acid mutarotase